jgi:hypothetical protein
MPEPASLQMNLSFDVTKGTLTSFRDGDFCGPGGCVSYAMPFPFTTLQSGHSLTINPESPSNWNSSGTGQMAVVDVNNAANPLTDAFISGGTTVSGTEEMISATVTLKENASPNRPFKMKAANIIVGGPAAEANTSLIDLNPPVIIVGQAPFGPTCGAVEGAPCDDGNPCTTDDACSQAFCFGVAVNCDDGNDCTADLCDTSVGCTHENISGSCEDGNPCTEADTCSNGNCLQGVPRDCEDGVACTADACANGVCDHVAINTKCEDGMFCTSDICDPIQGCIYPESDIACDDGFSCTVDLCEPNDPNSGTNGCINFLDDSLCNDNVACTVDSCNASSKFCENVPNDGFCEDGVLCTEDICDLFDDCRFVEVDNNCDDNVSCTENICNKIDDCQFP